MKCKKNVNSIYDYTFLNKNAIKHYMIRFHLKSKLNSLFLKKKKRYLKKKKTLFVNM